MCLSKTNVSANLSAKRYLNSKNLALEFPRIITSLGSTVEGSKASEDQDEGAERDGILFSFILQSVLHCVHGDHSSSTFLSGEEYSFPFLVPPPQPGFEITLFTYFNLGL